MRPQISRLEYLRESITDLDDDLSLPWDTYPCLEWPYNKDWRGYGVIGVAKKGQRTRNIRVHRYSLELKLGISLPPERGSLHRCDNPPCYRPSHLFDGTTAENLEDMKQKGRGPWNKPRPSNSGERNHKAKLTWEHVHEIRRLYAQGVAQSILAAQFGLLGESNISAVVCNKTWKDAAYVRPLGVNQRTGSNHVRARLHWCEIEEIRRLNSLGVSMYKLAKMFRCGSGHIHGIVHGEYWKPPVERPTITLSQPIILEAHTEAQWRALCERYGNHCLCCGANHLLLTKDHVIPPGEPGYSDSIDNIQPLCQSCNSRKGNRHSTDYRDSLFAVILSS